MPPKNVKITNPHTVKCVAILLLFLALIPSNAGCAKQTADFDLSFKPFGINELLGFKIEVDLATCGTQLQSEELQRIANRVSELRGLEFSKPAKFRKCSETVVRYEILQTFSEETPSQELESDRKLLAALGLIPAEENLAKTLMEILTEQIAGTYSTETKEITIMQEKQAGEATEEITIAHEVTHCLQDQNFHLDMPPLDEESFNGDNEIAIQSLAEGDATLTMLDYAEKYSDIVSLMREESQIPDNASEKLEKAPFYIRESLLFPYQEGLEFAMYLKTIGGYDALNNAFRNPPLSSEQIIHPEKYIAREQPKVIDIPDLLPFLPKGWKMINNDCVGELDLKLWFEQYCGASTSKDVSSGWGGNAIQYYQGRRNNYLLVNIFDWDSKEDAQEFFDGYRNLISERFGKVKEKRSGESFYMLEDTDDSFFCSIDETQTLCLQANKASLIQDVAPAFGALGGLMK
ncbi:MAG: hypothetical protein PHO53_05895 [Actinomycetota bacterium]|nr:hypothetical protein [Actinomycetota bacterium]